MRKKKISFRLNVNKKGANNVYEIIVPFGHFASYIKPFE